jgi:uncharacterized protein YcbX
MTARLVAIRIYPVKACRRVELDAARLGATGLADDRDWMVTRPDGRFLSQRSHPALARLVPRLTDAGLELGCAGLAPLAVRSDAAGEVREVAVWDDRMLAVDAGGIAAAWLTRALGEPARLVRVSRETRRFANRAYVGARDVPVSFADAYPILVCSTASLAVLNARLPAPVPMERFRPNLVLDGLEPFAEDSIGAVRIGAVVLRFVKPCTRCTVPSIDQDSGERSTDPGPALKAFRYDPVLRGVLFGVNAVAEGPPGAALVVGAPVEVVA